MYQGYDYELSNNFPIAHKINVYSIAMSDLLSIKMRVYRAKARSITLIQNDNIQVTEEWPKLLKNIELSLVIFDKLVTKDLTTKIELLLLKGITSDTRNLNTLFHL